MKAAESFVGREWVLTPKMINVINDRLNKSLKILLLKTEPELNLLA